MFEVYCLLVFFTSLVGILTCLQTNTLTAQADGIESSLENNIQQFHKLWLVNVLSYIPVIKQYLPKQPNKKTGGSSYVYLPVFSSNFMAHQALSEAKKNARVFAKQKKSFESSVIGMMLTTFGASLEDVKSVEDTHHSKIYVCFLLIGLVLLATSGLNNLLRCIKSRPGTENPASEDQTDNQNDVMPMDQDPVTEKPAAGESSLEEIRQNHDRKNKQEDEEETGNHYDEKEEVKRIKEHDDAKIEGMEVKEQNCENEAPQMEEESGKGNHKMEEKEQVENYEEETMDSNEKDDEKQQVQGDENKIDSTDSDVNNNSENDDDISNGKDDYEMRALVEIDQYRFKIAMAEQDMDLIFSEKGNLIKPLQGKALVNILPPKKGDPYLNLDGEREEVEIALEAIFDYVRHWKRNHQPVRSAPEPDHNLRRKGENEFCFEVDKEYAGITVGKGGVHANKYAQDHKVTVQVIRNNESLSSALIILRGQPGSVHSVYNDIMERLENSKLRMARKELAKSLGKCEEVVPGLLQVAGNRYEFPITGYQRGYIIGQSGNTVNTLQDYFRVAIRTHKDDTDANSFVCVLRGLKDDVILAYEEIQLILQEKGLNWELKE